MRTVLFAVLALTAFCSAAEAKNQELAPNTYVSFKIAGGPNAQGWVPAKVETIVQGGRAIRCQCLHLMRHVVPGRRSFFLQPLSPPSGAAYVLVETLFEYRGDKGGWKELRSADPHVHMPYSWASDQGYTLDAVVVKLHR